MNLGNMTAIDLYAGSGGLSLGLRQAGFNVAGAVEIDEVASATYRKNHPRTTLVTKDVRDVTSDALRKVVGTRRLHLLAGCAPCQGFCSLTSKWGREDPRNRLVLEMARFVEELRPDAVFMENVPGLITRGTALLEELSQRLRAAGYYAETRVVQMADFGVPQNRRRLVLLAGNGFMIPFPVQTHAKDPEGGSGLKKWVTVRDAIYGWSAPLKLSRAVTRGGPQQFKWHVVRDLQPQTRRRLQAAYPGKTWLSVDEDIRPECHRDGYKGFTNVYGRMAWDNVAVTMTSGCTSPCKGRFGHPDRRRTTISVREAARLQTFPLSYHFETDHMDAACEMIGNAVPPLFAKLVAKQISNTLREHYAALAWKS